MAITQGVCTSFKVDLLNGVFDFGVGTSQTFRVALYTSSADIGPGTSSYTSDNEVADGNGYSTGGKALTINQPPTADGTTAILDFDDVTWTNANFTARGALIYMDDGGDNPTVAVVDFGSDKIASGGDFSLIMPTPAASSAVVRIS